MNLCSNTLPVFFKFEVEDEVWTCSIAQERGPYYVVSCGSSSAGANLSFSDSGDYIISLYTGTDRWDKVFKKASDILNELCYFCWQEMEI